MENSELAKRKEPCLRSAIGEDADEVYSPLQSRDSKRDTAKAASSIELPPKMNEISCSSIISLLAAFLVSYKSFESGS